MAAPLPTYLQRGAVNDEKWNACIASAANGLVYAYTDYLDAMAGEWDAVVLDDYKAVMPLPWRKKWGFRYLYPPFLTAQLGIFGAGVNAATVEAFLRAVPSTFRFWDLSLNHGNLFSLDSFPLYERRNFVLPLNRPYGALYKGYRENIRRNVKKSAAYGCSCTTGIPVDSVIALAQAQAKNPNKKDFQNFANLFARRQQNGTGKTYGVVSATGELLASAAFLFSHHRAYYLLVGNHPNGRTLGASHALIDAFIQDHADRDLLLDFEGSDLRNLAFFYGSFGAKEEKYPAIKLNRLPWWIRWAKTPDPTSSPA